MAISTELLERSENKCELCTAETELVDFTVVPKTGNSADDQVAVCATCLEQLTNADSVDPNHWSILNETMWSQVPAVQVVAFRMLNQLQSENWASSALEMMYLDDETREWAELSLGAAIVHKDSNGNILQDGDSVVLIKDLVVKGANFTAKRGTNVKRIRLVHDNAEHIEARVEDQQIVILTQYVKKT